MLLDKSLDEITESDLQALVSARVAERRTLDYKRELKISNDADKREFCADVVSFANSSGGILFSVLMLIMEYRVKF